MEKIQKQAEYTLKMWYNAKKLEKSKREQDEKARLQITFATNGRKMEKAETERKSLKIQINTHKNDADRHKGEIIGMIKTLNILGMDHDLQKTLEVMK